MFSLEPWTLWGITYYLRSSSQWMESAVSPLTHVICIQLFHKLVVAVMSTALIHVTIARELHRVKGSHQPLSCSCNRCFFRCERLLYSMWHLLYHSRTHYPLFRTAEKELWSCLHVNTRRPRQCAVVPEFWRTAFPQGLSWLPHPGPRPTYWYD